MTAMLPQPSLGHAALRAATGGSHILIDGDAPGIISTDPWTLQCAACGDTTSKPEARSWQTFLLTSGYGFHICTSGSEGRLCGPCKAAVVAECELGGCLL